MSGQLIFQAPNAPEVPKVSDPRRDSTRYEMPVLACVLLLATLVSVVVAVTVGRFGGFWWGIAGGIITVISCYVTPVTRWLTAYFEDQLRRLPEALTWSEYEAEMKAFHEQEEQELRALETHLRSVQWPICDAGWILHQHRTLCDRKTPSQYLFFVQFYPEDEPAMLVTGSLVPGCEGQSQNGKAMLSQVDFYHTRVCFPLMSLTRDGTRACGYKVANLGPDTSWQFSQPDHTPLPPAC